MKPASPNLSRLARQASLVLCTLWMAGCSSLTPFASSTGKSSAGAAPVLSPASTVLKQADTRHDPASGLKVDLGGATIAPKGHMTLPTEPVVQVKPVDPMNPGQVVDLDDLSARQDLWERIRTGFKLPELQSELVDQHVQWYAARPEYVSRMTQRANRYLFHIVEEVERRGLPAELALLPFIESAFNPQALSSARASGIWQFMPATGKHFDLHQNLFRDDRRDVLASTDAALSYLQRLHRMFGDWHLALAAYNWGEGNVQRAIRRNAQQGLPTDYLSLSMPAETRHYVPKLHAVRQLVLAPQAHRVSLAPIENHPYFLSVPIERDIDVALAAELADLPIADFRALNPSMNKPVILAAGTPQILLPYENASQFSRNLRTHQGPLASWTAWQVPHTMRPAEAAQKLGMSERELRDINRIPPRMVVKAGSTLLVPRSERHDRDVSERLADSAMIALAPDGPTTKRRVVRARAKDTVRTIARRHGVTALQVAQWNKVGTKAGFAQGHRVVLYLPVKQRAIAGDGRGGKKVAKGSRQNKVAHKATRQSGKQSKVRVASVR